jgi:hypothetical protein
MPPTLRAGDGFQLAVYAKAPVPGAVKTRLAPVLGEAGAAELHRWLTRRALATAQASGACAVSLWCAPDCAHPFFAECQSDYGVALHEQSGADLGARMLATFEALLDDGPVLLMGSDCPSVSDTDLRSAAASLLTHDVVLQPAEDGGYVLVGMRRAVPQMFEGIAWSTATVMRDTRRRLRAAGATWREMPTRWDVDRPEDVARLQDLGWHAQAEGHG